MKANPRAGGEDRRAEAPRDAAERFRVSPARTFASRVLAVARVTTSVFAVCCAVGCAVGCATPPSGPVVASSASAPPKDDVLDRAGIDDAAAADRLFGNLGAVQDDVVLEVVFSPTFVVFAFPTGVEVRDRFGDRVRFLPGALTPLALDASGTLLVSSATGLRRYALERSTLEAEEISLGRRPTALKLDAGVVAGTFPDAAWTLRLDDVNVRTGEMFLGAMAPTPLALDHHTVLLFDRLAHALQTRPLLSSETLAWQIPLVETVTVAGGALDAEASRAIAFGTDGGAHFVCVTSNAACVHAPLPAAVAHAAFVGRMPIVLDIEGRLWTLDDAAHPALLYDPGTIVAPTTSLATSKGGTDVVITHQNVVTHLRAPAWTEVSPVGHRDHVTDLAFSPSGDVLFSVAVDGTVKAWDSATGRLRASQTLTAALGGVWAVKALSDDDVVVLSSPDRITRLALSTGAEQFSVTLNVPRDSTATLALSPGTVWAWSPHALVGRSVTTGAPLFRAPRVRLPHHSVFGATLLPLAGADPKTPTVLVRRAQGCATGGIADAATTEHCRAVSPEILAGRRFAAGPAGQILSHGPTTVWAHDGTSDLVDLGSERFDAVFVVADGQAAIFVGRAQARKVSLTADHVGEGLWTIPLRPFARLRAVALSSDGRWIARAGIPADREGQQRDAWRSTIAVASTVDGRAISLAPVP